MVTAVLTSTLLAAAVPRIWPDLGSTFTVGTLALAALLLAQPINALLCGLDSRYRRGADRAGHMPTEQAVAEVREVSPYLTVMSQHLSEALRETEQGVVALINQINDIHQVSASQLDTIEAAEQQGAHLSQVVREKIAVDQQLGSILEMFVERQEADSASNLQRLQRLQEVKSLGPLVDVIASVAQQTNFLSINAAIEAAHAGESGRSFAVLAAEIRQLSNRTAEAATDIVAKIHAATEGIDEELAKAGDLGGKEAASHNMRKVLADIDALQKRFAEATRSFQSNLVDGVKTGHQGIVSGLAGTLGGIQFHDVMRQRVEHVQLALDELNEHLQSMADQLHDRPWNPETMVTLRQRLQQQVAGYVMKSQVNTFQSATGGGAAVADERPAIELF